MKNCKWMLYAPALLACAFAATAADAPNLTFKFTKTNIPGALLTTPFGVNNAGVSVGTCQDKNLNFHGYILKGKKLTTLDEPNGTNAAANGINPNGAISVVGLYYNSTGFAEGFRYKGGKFTDIPGPKGAIASFASGINDAGAIVGSYFDSAGYPHGYLLKGGKYKTLDVPGARVTYATGINDAGHVVLYWLANGAVGSSLWNGKTYKTIDVPGALQTFAYGINTAGDVVYGWVDSSNVEHGAVQHAGKFYKFSYPKAVFTSGQGINDHNLIVGEFQTTTMDPGEGFKATYK